MLDFLKKLLDEGLEAFIKYASGGDTGVYYINGSESLPPPLTREEEEQAFKLLETDFAAARETLIVHNLRLVVYIAKKFENTGRRSGRPCFDRHHRTYQSGKHIQRES